LETSGDPFSVPVDLDALCAQISVLANSA